LYVRQFHKPFTFLFTGNFSKQILSCTDLYVFCRVTPSVTHVICVVEVICHSFWFDYNLEYPVYVNVYQSCFKLWGCCLLVDQLAEFFLCERGVLRVKMGHKPSRTQNI